MALNTRVQKDHPGLNSRVRLDGPSASSGRNRFGPLVGTLFLLPICWGSATPARADVTVDGTSSSAAVATRATGPHTLFQTSTVNALLEESTTATCRRPPFGSTAISVSGPSTG